MASKKESNFLNMVLTLFIVAVVAALALGGVYSLTKEPIAIAKQKKLEAAIKAVLPDFDTIIETKVPDKSGDSLTFYYAEKKGKKVGTAIKTFSKEGFGGEIDILVGFLDDGTISNTVVLAQKETPGLGDKMSKSKSDFPDQFIGKNPATFKLYVKKDGGDVDAITAATISSRAFCDALRRAYETFEKSQESRVRNQESGN
ncbi:MAG: RnfABCDGE type electron transport complex subunit G [Chlorobi bacterium]|nr:RnfABCDGE type electron transport complex subunit G [Chlorobiota bacterium]